MWKSMAERQADLGRDVERFDGRPYGFYKELRGRSYALGLYRLNFDHIQGDPFATPSRLRIDIPANRAKLPDWSYAGADTRRASADFVHRVLLRQLSSVRGRLGSGKSGLLEIMTVGQQVLERTAVLVSTDGALRVRLSVGLPAAGRRILGREASELLTRCLPDVLNSVFDELDILGLQHHVHCVEDQVVLRQQLNENGLVAFLTQGSVLPRRSGADDRPMDEAIPLDVPEALACELDAPHAGRLRGLGIRTGVTLIAGGGYHGKSTLLSVLANSVYDHIPGDGRSRCVVTASAVSIRAEDGRSVRGVDLRPFINALPLGRKTDWFDTDDASGSTSQAAAIIESLEAGATALLVDEDTAATNFMIRDARMRRLVPSEKEPITPYLDRVRQLWEEKQVSSILVVGGAGDYLDVADTVIQMDEYRPKDVTSQAGEIARELPPKDSGPQAPGAWLESKRRRPDPRSFDPSRGRKQERVRSVKTRAIEFGSEEIDVSLLYQLVDAAQCRMIGDVLLQCSRGLCDGKKSMSELLDRIDAEIEKNNLDTITDRGFGDRARARRFEISAALNRLRSLRLVRTESD